MILTQNLRSSDNWLHFGNKYFDLMILRRVIGEYLDYIDGVSISALSKEGGTFVNINSKFYFIFFKRNFLFFV